jgi:hypothetical protein
VDAIHALATSLAVRAFRRGVFLDVDIHQTARPGVRESAALRDALLRAIDCSVPGEVARFSGRYEGSFYVIRLITPIEPGCEDDMRELDIPGAVVDPSEPEMLWELRIDDGGQA